MHGWAKNKFLPALCGLAFFASSVCAGEFSAQITDADLTVHDGGYLLNADIEHLLSPAAKEAVQSSIPLKWCLKIRVKQLGYFYNKTVLRLDYCYSIRYHALLNHYSIINNAFQSEKKYASLAQALDSLTHIRDVKIMPATVLQPGRLYQVQIKLNFDKEQLPPPLRPLAYLKADWDLSSDWYLWTLQKN